MRRSVTPQRLPREAAWSTLRRSGTFPAVAVAEEPARPRREIVAWCAVAALALATLFRLSPMELPILEWGKMGTPQLHLSAIEDSAGVRLQWTPPGNSSGGILSAADDAGTRTLALSAPVVQGGNLLYGPVHGTTRFELAIQVGSSGWKSERIAYLRTPAWASTAESADRMARPRRAPKRPAIRIQENSRSGSHSRQEEDFVPPEKRTGLLP